MSIEKQKEKIDSMFIRHSSFYLHFYRKTKRKDILCS